MAAVSPSPSPELLAAQARLLRLRAEANAGSHDGRRPPWSQTVAHDAPPRPAESQEKASHDYQALVDALPEHLGWGSQQLTAVLRRRSLAKKKAAGSPALPANQPQLPAGDRPSLPSGVKLYPDIGLGMLRNEMAAAGRIWLLLRHLDQAGEGKLRIVNLRRQLTEKESSLRVCGQRQLRNLLNQGEGVFWQRDKERLWLRSAAKAAAALGVDRLTGRPVSLPVAVLLGPIGEVRAHLYASFHAGRRKGSGGRDMAITPHKPIARATLEQLSGITPQGQRLYEQRAGVDVRSNYAVGEQSTPQRYQERAWKQGGGVFQLVDHNGRQGRKGGTYLAWQLPNSYHTTYRQRPKGQQKRINRQLADLFMKGMTGNGSMGIEKRYYSQAAQAAKAYTRHPVGQVYWQRHRTRVAGGMVWQVIGNG